MTGLDKLNFLTSDQREQILLSEKNYKRFARIYFRVHEYNEKRKDVTVKVWQDRNVSGKYLSVEELRERAREVFNMLPEGMRLHVHARTFAAYGIDEVDIDYITEQMEKLNLKQADLVDYLNINKSTISSWLSGSKELTNIHKAMFFYFFKYLGQ